MSRPTTIDNRPFRYRAQRRNEAIRNRKLVWRALKRVRFGQGDMPIYVVLPS